MEIILTRLSSGNDVVLTLASFSTEALHLQKLIDVPMEFESRQARAVIDASFHTHLVEAAPTTPTADSVRGGHPPSTAHGQGF